MARQPVEAPEDTILEKRLEEVEAAMKAGDEFERSIEEDDSYDEIEELDPDIPVVDPADEQGKIVHATKSLEDPPEEPKADDDEGDEEEEEEAETEEEDEDDGDSPEPEDEEPEEDDDEEEGEGEEEAPEEGEDGPSEEAYVAKLPGRRPGDPDLEIELDGLTDQEAEAFARMRNSYLRREDLRGQQESVEQSRGELKSVILEVQTDPVGFVLKDLEKDDRIAMARHLMGEEEIYKEVIDEIAGWSRNTDKKELAQAKLKLERVEMKAKASDARSALVRHHESVRQVRLMLQAVVPEGTGEEETGAFFQAAAFDLKQYIESSKADALSPKQAIEVLDRSGALRRYGIARDDAESILAELDLSATSTGAPRTAKKAGKPSREEKARNTGKELKKRRAKRRAASTTPSAGGAPIRLKMPKGQTVEQAAEYALRHMK